MGMQRTRASVSCTPERPSRVGRRIFMPHAHSTSAHLPAASAPQFGQWYTREDPVPGRDTRRVRHTRQTCGSSRQAASFCSSFCSEGFIAGAASGAGAGARPLGQNSPSRPPPLIIFEQSTSHPSNYFSAITAATPVASQPPPDPAPRTPYWANPAAPRSSAPPAKPSARAPRSAPPPCS